MMEGLEILYDHYKDTFEQQKGYLAKRDHLTIYLMILAILLIGLIFDPNYVSTNMNMIFDAQVDKLTFDLQFINTGLIIVFFWLSLQYYMVVLQIERMYQYLNQCEDSLCAFYTGFKINREGAYYLKSYPWMKTLADKFFVIGIPLSFIVLSVCKIVNEYYWTISLRFVDFVFLVLILIYSVLYISNRVFHEEYFDKETHPNLHLFIRLKRYFTN